MQVQKRWSLFENYDQTMIMTSQFAPPAQQITGDAGEGGREALFLVQECCVRS